MGKPARSPRIFWFSNSPTAPTGYGTQTAQVVRRLKKRGHDVAVAANFGQQLTMGKWQGVTVYPQGYDGYSQDVIGSHWRDFVSQSDDPAVMVTLFDVWTFKAPTLRTVPRILSWTPVDHMNVVPGVKAWVSNENVTPVAMSKHGLSALERAGVEAEYAPHALEKHWKPTDFPEDPWPGRFVVTMPQANKGVLPSRKSWGENLLAFAMFAQKHPEALLYLHTEARPQHGIDLVALVEACGIDKSQVTFADQYQHRMGVPDSVMAQIYTRSDVLLSASAGEGFGLPVLEAQACGTRVVVSDFSAQPELVGDGWTVEVQPQWNPTQAGWFATPLVGSIVDALEEAFAAGGGRSETAIAFAEGYDADRVFAERWQPILDRAA
ncbi:MAG TPA: glycosyltransferase family 4 protein [Acidimicrobiia bacterium]